MALTQVMSLIVDFYSSGVSKAEVEGYPFLSQLFVHDECEIAAIHGMEGEGEEVLFRFGWHATDGRFVRVGPKGNPFRDKDRTIASLLAALHWRVARAHFNRFFSYTDEIRGRDVLPYRFSGMRWAWTDLQAEEARRFTAETPQRN